MSEDKKISSSGDLALYLLEEAKVALVHGEAFGDDDYVKTFLRDLSWMISGKVLKESGKRLSKLEVSG